MKIAIIIKLVFKSFENKIINAFSYMNLSKWVLESFVTRFVIANVKIRNIIFSVSLELYLIGKISSGHTCIVLILSLYSKTRTFECIACNKRKFSYFVLLNGKNYRLQTFHQLPVSCRPVYYSFYCHNSHLQWCCCPKIHFAA